MLTEGEIAGTVGVSRTPVREALLRLAAEDLVELYPKRGALVRTVSADEIRDLRQARELVETFAVVAALRSGHKRLAVELAERLRQMRAAAADGDIAAFSSADRAFHCAIVAAAGNQIVRRWYEQIRDRQLRMRSLLVPEAADRMATAIAEHEAIAAAIEAGDTEAGRRAVVAHLDTFLASVWGER